MVTKIKIQLEEIGLQLDASIFPIVMNGGLVMSSKPSILNLTLDKEQLNERKTRSEKQTDQPEITRKSPRTGGKPTYSRTSAESGGTRTACSTSSFSLNSADDKLYAKLSEVQLAYPETTIYKQEEMFWLRVESLLLPGLGRKAIFLLAVIPKFRKIIAWGYWSVWSIGVSWIGPRHTNYPDGSMCAFDMMDGSWQYGDNLVKLLDFYTVWAVRHLYLEYFDRWPGPQASSSYVERNFEFKDHECCGCPMPQGTYHNCCKPNDIAKITPAAALSFWIFSKRDQRHPPSDITNFARLGINPPRLELFC
ncbi:MAG: hypothetical protein HOP24_01320 [Sideroxydans sp.]|nr:hypothetical protein [Sideroxydans sp.]